MKLATFSSAHASSNSHSSDQFEVVMRRERKEYIDSREEEEEEEEYEDDINNFTPSVPSNLSSFPPPTSDSLSSGSDELNFFHFFGDLLTSDLSDRLAAIKLLIDRLTCCLSSPIDSFDRTLLSVHLPSVIRLSIECPFSDVRIAFQEFLNLHSSEDEEFAKAKPKVEGPSYFISVRDCVIINSPDELEFPSSPSYSPRSSSTPSLSHQFRDIFLYTGRVSHIDQLIAFHPTYLRAYTRTMQCLMDEDGPLSQTWRHYIAILASSSSSCAYLVHQQEWEYLSKGGDRRWLHSITHAPKKLQQLQSLTQLLSHSPWLLTTSHIQSLTVGDGEGETWSVSELVQAIMILVTFHSLSILVFGLGVTPEVDIASLTPPVLTPNLSTSSNMLRIDSANSTSPPSMSPQDEGERLRNLLLNAPFSPSNQKDRHSKTFDSIEDNSSPPILQNPLSSRTLQSTLPISTSNNNISAETWGGIGILGLSSSSNPCCDDISHSINISFHSRYNTPVTRNFPFNVKTDNIFYLHDYSWKADALSLVSRFYSDFALILDEEWDLIDTLTYSRVGKSPDAFNTLPFRRAISYYTQRLYGLCQPDYDYSNINVILTQNLRHLIRDLVYQNQIISKKQFEMKEYDFTVDEKVHIILLIMEARRQSGVLYGLHAVMKHMNGTTEK